MAKNKQLNLIAIVKMLNIGFINKHIINLGMGGGGVGGGGGGGFSVLLNYHSLASKFFSLVPSQLFFSTKYRRNRLLRVSFLKL